MQIVTSRNSLILDLRRLSRFTFSSSSLLGSEAVVACKQLPFLDYSYLFVKDSWLSPFVVKVACILQERFCNWINNRVSSSAAVGVCERAPCCFIVSHPDAANCISPTCVGLQDLLSYLFPPSWHTDRSPFLQRCSNPGVGDAPGSDSIPYPLTATPRHRSLP